MELFQRMINSPYLDINGSIKNMTQAEIEQAIRDTIMEAYKSEYVGSLEITRINPIGLSVRLGIMNDLKPMYISAELDDVQFLKYFKKELYDRNLDMVEFFKGVKSYPDDCIQQIDTRCGCHE